MGTTLRTIFENSTRLTVGLALVGSLALPAKAAEGSYTCKVKTNDVGTITGVGPSQNSAWEEAMMQCYDRYDLRHRMRNPAGYDDDTKLAVIDVCVNIKCE